MASRLLALSPLPQHKLARCRQHAQAFALLSASSLSGSKFTRHSTSKAAAPLFACSKFLRTGGGFSTKSSGSQRAIAKRSMSTDIWFLDTDRASRSEAPGKTIEKGGQMPTEILINALQKNPPLTPRDVLDRIDEARANGSNRYLQAIIDSILADGDKAAANLTADSQLRASDQDPKLKFSDHLLNNQVCGNLLEAIAASDPNPHESRIGSHTVVALYNIARERGWQIEPSVIQGVAIFLANNSFFGYKRSVRIMLDAARRQPKKQKDKRTASAVYSEVSEDYIVSRMETYELPIKQILLQMSSLLENGEAERCSAALADDPLDAVVGMARLLIDRGFSPSSAFYMLLARALCVRERESDAEWLFGLADGRSDRHSGIIHALMMSMYYRLGKTSKADALFDKFRASWGDRWGSIRSIGVMPDATSASAERWRLINEEGVEDVRLLHVEELRSIRRNAAMPYYCRALHLIVNKQVAEAAALISDAKYRDFVAFSPEQFSKLTESVIVGGNTDLGFELYSEIQRGVNVNGGSGISASDVIFDEIPGHRVHSRLLYALGSIDDWDRIWLVHSEGKDGREKVPHSSVYTYLIYQALKTNNAYQAIKCATELQRLAALHTAAVERISDEWIREAMVLAKDLTRSGSLSGGERHPFVAFVDGLLFKEIRSRNMAYPEWNSRVLRIAFEVLHQRPSPLAAGIQAGIFAVVKQEDHLRFLPVCYSMRSICVSILDATPKGLQQTPQKIEDTAGGWSAYLDHDFIQGSVKELLLVNGSLMSAESAFWQCAVDVLVRSVKASNLEETARYLLLTLKLAYLINAEISPHSLKAANKILLGAKCPIVDTNTCDLLPLASQLKSGSAYVQLPEPAKGLQSKETGGQMELSSWRITKRGAAIAKALKYDTPWREKLQWYKQCRRRREIPNLRVFKWLVVDLINHGKRTDWEPIFRDHMPEYIEALTDARCADKLVHVKYAAAIWTQAVIAYTLRGELEEATLYYRRIINEGAYPLTTASGCLLSALRKDDAPLPVLNRGWDGPATRIFGVEPALPPAAESAADQFLVPLDAKDRRRLLAELGMSMLYSSVKHALWPSTYFYCVLLSVLGEAGMLKEIRHIFEDVVPTTTRGMPAHLRINPSFIPTPFLWTTAIKWAYKCGSADLAQYWFKEYRMSAMPLFREESSAFSRDYKRRFPPSSRLFSLATPYYPFVRAPKPGLGGDNRASSVCDAKYDLKYAEMQLEMDRLRALDKLPMPSTGALLMLSIYTEVDEHRDMDAAELLAEEIIVFSQSKSHHPPEKISSFSICLSWKLMIQGYVEDIRQQQSLATPDIATINKAKVRIAHWYGLWKQAYERCLDLPSSGIRECSLGDGALEHIELLTRDLK